jgi:hypothetical protein
LGEPNRKTKGRLQRLIEFTRSFSPTTHYPRRSMQKLIAGLEMLTQLTLRKRRLKRNQFSFLKADSSQAIFAGPFRSVPTSMTSS